MKTIAVIFILIFLPRSFKAQSESKKEFSSRLMVQLNEEKFAKDFYNSMYSQWKLLAFRNLAKCEELHMKVTLGLIGEYGDLKSVKNLAPGEYGDENLNITYNNFQSKSKKSENDALIAAGSFEEKNIESIESLMKFPEGQINQDCLNNLLESSIDHLNLLVCHLRHRGIEYKPVSLSVAKYIKCIGDQYSDLDNPSYSCQPDKNKENCLFLKGQ